ncbi:MAG: hypothetical protein ACLSFZ_00645 [Frisingicoccus sp.]
MEAAYGFRYPGEVLERYAEKIGSSDKVIRTLALTLAEMKPLLSKSMFVGKQYEIFMQTIRRNAEKDLFCKGALFLLEENAEKGRSFGKFMVISMEGYNGTGLSAVCL